MFSYRLKNKSALFYRWIAFIVIIAFLATSMLPSFIKFTPSVQASISPPVSLTAVGTPYTQNFDTLVNTGTGTSAANTPPGWDFAESGTNANTTYTAGTGSSTAGDTYSFGSTAATDRAFGGLQSGSLIPIVGADFTNNTGVAITTLSIAYTGEQWRLGATARVDRMDFQYSLNATSLSDAGATWVDVDQLDFTAPIQSGTVGALDGNAAANRTALTFDIVGLNIPNGATFFIRWNDFNATGSDDGLAVDDFSLTPNPSGGGQPSLSINDVTVTEGNSGTTNATFTVSLSSPAGAGGVTFNIATADGTATVADNDYVALSLTGETIAQGQSSKQYNVIVNGDTTPEPNETFFVNVTNVTGATVFDGQGIGTISNDDFVAIPINQIQGSGNTSPLVGQVVTTTGIVTGLRSNGFFIETPDAQQDSNPNTSEGIFVFTSSAPPAAAAIGNSVAVTGTIAEFIPAADPVSPPLTEFSATGLMVSQLSTGNPLPTPVTLTAADTVPGGALEQLEKYEGMRVRVNSLTVIAPTQGSITETSATATSNGVFYGVITGVPRPLREPGIEIPNVIPTPTPNPNNIPRFDGNSEKIRVDSDAQTGTTALNVTGGATITNLVGPLDYAFRAYTILPDLATPPTVTGNINAIPVPPQTNRELTIATFNMQRFFDNVDDPTIGEPVLTTTAYNNRLNKASLAIRNVMRMPDVIGVEEMENLTVLQTVATKVNDDAVAAGQPNPMYTASLIEGNDVGGIDVGFLVKTARITVVAVTQFGKTTTYINPITGLPELLNDRPPLVLQATAPNANGGAAIPFTVIVNHLRSLSGIDDPTDGIRVRAKRKAQAEYLATLIQDRQTADPNERIVCVGDMNAFQFNDGFVDIIGTVKGTPTPADQVLTASSDLVNPDLVNLVDLLPADQRYSFMFDGNGQVLDHIIVNQKMLLSLNRFHYARNNSEFPQTFYGDPARPERISDHDPSVAYFSLGTRFKPDDFDGDGMTDLSVWRPTNGIWYIRSSANGSIMGPQWGVSTDKIAPDDFDGDGKTDAAVWRPAPATQAAFLMLNSSNNTARTEIFGQTNDQSNVTGDWDGDGKADVAVYRNGAGAGQQSTFFYRGTNNNPGGNITFLPFGLNGDKPVRGDFDGDGKQDAAVFRPGDGTWHILQSSNGQYRVIPFGLSADKPVAADYDGDGKTDVAVFRSSDATWYILQSSDNAVRYQPFGLATDVLVPGNYDIDGRADIAVYRNGTLYILQSYNNSVRIVPFGSAGDIPTQSAYLPQ